jgi:hypothetical protein
MRIRRNAPVLHFLTPSVNILSSGKVTHTSMNNAGQFPVPEIRNIICGSFRSKISPSPLFQRGVKALPRKFPL